MHSYGVLHNDLHSGNILVTASGQIFIVDFDQAAVGAGSKELEAEERLFAHFLGMRRVGL